MTALRKQFPILHREVNDNPLIYFDNAATTQKPQSVIDAVSEFYSTYNANVHRSPHTLGQEATAAIEKVRDQVAHFINTEHREEIIFTSGTTESINTIAYAFESQLHPGDEILISEMEHHANIVPWQIITEKTGAKIIVAPITDDGTIDIIKFESLLNKKTKLVCIAHVSNTLGTINPVTELTHIAKNKDIPVLIDGAQAPAHVPINVTEIGCDFYAFSAHKMYGPTGTGILYGKKSWLEKLPPFKGGGEMIKSVSFDKTVYEDIPYKFEAGTPNIAGIIGLGAAIDFLTSHTFTKIQDHEHELLHYATEKLSDIDGLTIIGTAPHKIGIISFTVEDIHHYDLGVLLDKEGIAVRTGQHCTEPLMDRYGVSGTVRISFGVYNTKQEIDHFISALKKVITMLS